MIAAEIKLDPQALQRALADIRGAAAFAVQAQAKALTYVARKGKTQGKRGLMAVTGLKARETTRRTFARAASAKPGAKSYLRSALWFGMRGPLNYKPRTLPHPPFDATLNGKSGQYVRVPWGTGYTSGRPQTSSPNLPIVAVEDWPTYGKRREVEENVKAVLKREGELAMRQHYEKELRRLLAGMASGAIKARRVR